MKKGQILVEHQFGKWLNLFGDNWNFITWKRNHYKNARSLKKQKVTKLLSL